MQTIAQQLKIKDFPFKINNKNGDRIYYENRLGYWARGEYDSIGGLKYYINSIGYWYKMEYDSNGRQIYYENSKGTIKDKRPKTEIQKALELLEKEGMLVEGKIIKN